VVTCLDKTDLLIIKELSINSRVPYRELADKMELSVTAVHKRIQALVAQGIIKKFITYPSPKIIPWIFISIEGRSEVNSLDTVIERLSKHPSTERIGLASGNLLFIYGILPDVSEVKKYVDLVVREAKLVDPSISLRDESHLFGADSEKFTNMDYRILSALIDDSRKQVVDVAMEIGVSVGTVRRRIERMEKNRMIISSLYIDPASMGDVFAIVYLTIKKGIDQAEVTRSIQSRYEQNLLSIWAYDTLPGIININVWAKSMTELNVIRDNLRKEELFEKIVPVIPYEIIYYDTWLTKHIREKALSGK